jgi:predicted nucleic acid-binding protein
MIERLCVSHKVFVDSNILVYAHDVDEPQKRQIAIRIFEDLWASKSGALSMQVLQEFYSIATRKIARPLPKPIAREAVERLAPWCIETTPNEIVSAFRIEDTAKISFWDALIVAAAIKAGAEEILSEDMNAGQAIAGIRIVNPFADAS